MYFAFTPLQQINPASCNFIELSIPLQDTLPEPSLISVQALCNRDSALQS